MCFSEETRLYYILMDKLLIEDKLPAFFEGKLNAEDKEKVKEWIAANNENRIVFEETKSVWEQTERLRGMQKYNADRALEKVNKKIGVKSSSKFVVKFQRIAAILILPLLIATLYFSTKQDKQEVAEDNWYTLKTGAGMRSEFELPDGTKVFLNSSTTISYPLSFAGLTRNVELNGEAYFDVAENKKQPFIVNTGKIKIEVTGTEFKASNYDFEDLTEIVLVDGSVRLCQFDGLGEKKVIHTMSPGEKAILTGADNKLYLEKVNVDKYIAWKEGVLMFRDDSMEEVVRRLNRWFNVDITLNAKILDDYVYTATFVDESLIQVLDLLKMSAPIDYKIVQRKRKTDHSFSKMKIEIIQK